MSLHPAPRFRDDASYLITGGFGGFGSEVARWLVANGARHLALLGRRGAAQPEAQALLKQLRDAGATVVELSGDVSKRSTVANALAYIGRELPPLRGVFHAAMVLDDCRLQDLDETRLERVLGPKALGAAHLDAQTRDMALDHFVLFSSISAVLGNPGQGSYVAANAYLDALAQARVSQSLPGLSVDWGVVLDVGVVARDAQIGAHLSRLGIAGLHPHECLDALGRAMLSDEPCVGIFDVDWSRWARHQSGTARSARFAHLIESGAEQTTTAMGQLLAGFPEDEWFGRVRAAVAMEVAQVLHLEPGQIDVEVGLDRYGIDSLMTVELSAAIHGTFGVKLPSMLLMQGPSLSQLARRILDAAEVDPSVTSLACAPQSLPERPPPAAAPAPEASRRDEPPRASDTRLGELPAYADRTYDMFMHSLACEHVESEHFFQWLEAVELDGAYSFETARQCAQDTEVALSRSNGEELTCLNFSAYNYLGYANHPAVIEAAKEALDRHGLGAGSSPVISGTFAIHKRLEHDLADFMGLPGRAVSLFSSGYGANTGTISAFVKRGHHVVLDRSVHMSILEGAQLSQATISWFEHNDPSSLETVLRGISADNTRILVCAEGVYSADGDFGRLRELVGVAKRFGAYVLVDEAHSILLTGENGRGVASAQDTLADVDLFVITFSKALGGVGGALIADERIARYVNWFARCRMFSCGLDPAVTGGIVKSLELARGSDGDQRRDRLRENAAYLRDRLAKRLTIGHSESWIVPVIYGSERLTVPVNNFLQREGLDGSIMQFPSVPKDGSRVRLFVSSEHTTGQMDRAADILERAADRFGFARVPATAGETP